MDDQQKMMQTELSRLATSQALTREGWSTIVYYGCFSSRYLTKTIYSYVSFYCLHIACMHPRTICIIRFSQSRINDSRHKHSLVPQAPKWPETAIACMGLLRCDCGCWLDCTLQQPAWNIQQSRSSPKISSSMPALLLWGTGGDNDSTPLEP